MENQRIAETENLGKGTREFVPGEVLIVKENRLGYGAKKGARAIFSHYIFHADIRMASVEWIRDELSGSQMDGGYARDWFNSDPDGLDDVDRIMFQMGYPIASIAQR